MDQPGSPDQPTSVESRLRDEHLRTLGLMLAGFAHELNTPIGVIASQCESLGRCRQKLADILARPDLDAGDVEALRGVLAHMASSEPVLAVGLERARALVRELRLAARPDAGDQLVDVPLVEVIEGDLVLLQHLTRQGVTIERQFEARPVVRGRPALLGQVFLNLLRNAVEAMGGQGTITINVRQRDGRAEVEVLDTGPGVPDAVLAQLFEQECTTKCPETGTGLGLFMSRQVLARHDGTIAARNRPEGGAVFTVTLPVA
jgi:signal transduction histidine kinase